MKPYMEIRGRPSFFRMKRVRPLPSVGFAVRFPDGTAVLFVNGEVRRILSPDVQPAAWSGGNKEAPRHV